MNILLYDRSFINKADHYSELGGLIEGSDQHFDVITVHLMQYYFTFDHYSDETKNQLAFVRSLFLYIFKKGLRFSCGDTRKLPPASVCFLSGTASFCAEWDLAAEHSRCALKANKTLCIKSKHLSRRPFCTEGFKRERKKKKEREERERGGEGAGGRVLFRAR